MNSLLFKNKKTFERNKLLSYDLTLTMFLTLHKNILIKHLTFERIYHYKLNPT